MGVSLGDIFLFFKGNTEDVEQKMSSLQSTANSWAANVGGVIQGAFSFMVGGMLMNGLSSLAESFQSSAIGMNSSLETTTLQFKTLMGSMDLAKEHVAMLFEFAKNTPFETQPIIDASLKLQTFGGMALNTSANLTLVGNAAAAVNAPINNLSFWVGRLYSSIQNGKPFGEASAELQNLAVVGGDVTTKMENMQKAGASASDIWAVFTEHLHSFDGAMAEQASTWQGLVGTLTDSISMLGADIFRPFFDLARDGMKTLVDAFGSPVFESWKASAVSAMSDAAEWIRDLATSAIPVLIRAWNVLGPAVEAVGTILGQVGSIIADVADVAYSWGSSLMAQYASGIYAGIGWVTDALQWVGDQIAGWLEPHSPPAILPYLDRWGGEVAKIYMSGWTNPALFQTLRDFGKMATDVIANMFDSGSLGDVSLPELLVGTQGKMADALEELRTTGDVSEAAFAAIAAAAGGAGSRVAELAREYINLQRSNQRVIDAQKELAGTSAEMMQAQDALALAAMRGDAAGVASARSAQEEIRQRRNQAQARRDQAAADAKAAQSKLQQEQAAMDFQKQQISLLKQMVAEQEKANAATAKKTAKKGETEEEKNARLAKAAQDQYQFSLLSTQDKIDALKAKQATLNPGQAEYWRIASQIHDLEQTRSREIEANAKKEKDEADKAAKAQEALKQAQWDHAYAVADTATRLQMMKDKLATLNPEQTEYYSTLTSIANLENQLEKEREAADKKAKARAGGGGKGKKPTGGGGPGIPKAPGRAPKPPGAAAGAEERDNAPSFEGANPVAALAESLGAIISKIIPAKQYIAALQGAMSVMATSVQNLVLPAMKMLWDAWGKGMSTLAETGPVWETTMGKVIPALQLLWQICYAFIAFLVGTVVSVVAGMIPGAFMLLEGVFTALMGVVNLVADVFMGFVKLVVALIQGDWTGAWNAAKELVVNVGLDILQVLGGLFEGALGIIGSLVGGVVSFFRWLYIQLVGASIIPDMVNGIINWIIQMKDQFILWVDTLVKRAIELFDSFVKPIIDSVIKFKDGIIKTITDLAKDWIDKLLSITKEVQDWLTGLGTKSAAWAKDAGSALLNGFWNGLKAKWEEIWKWWSDKMQTIRDSLPGSEPKDARSPLRGLGDAGAALVGNIQAGMASAGDLQVPALTGWPNTQATMGEAAGGMGGMHLHFHDPVIRKDQDLKDLAYQVAKEIRKNQR